MTGWIGWFDAATILPTPAHECPMGILRPHSDWVLALVDNYPVLARLEIDPEDPELDCWRVLGRDGYTYEKHEVQHWTPLPPSPKGLDLGRENH